MEFEDAGGGKTAISLTLDYQPEGVVEKVGDLLHLVARDAEADLKKFKQFLARGPCKRGMAGNRPRWHRGCRNRRRGTTAAGDAGTGHAGERVDRPGHNRFAHPFDQTNGLVDVEGESDETADGEIRSAAQRREDEKRGPGFIPPPT